MNRIRFEKFPKKEIMRNYKLCARKNRRELEQMSESHKRAFLLLSCANMSGCSVQTVRNRVDIIEHYTLIR